VVDDRHHPKAVDREGTAGHVSVESLQRNTGVIDEGVDSTAFLS